MILVDTSVWIDHLRHPILELEARLRAREILCHDMVIGELACGNLKDRNDVLRDLSELPILETRSPAEVLALIEARSWMGRGIGYVDANLLGSVLTVDKATLWTRGRRLSSVADDLGVVHVPHEEGR